MQDVNLTSYTHHKKKKKKAKKKIVTKSSKRAFDNTYFCQLILLFSLFLQLFMGSIALFSTIHGSHCTISINFYLYL